MPSGCSVGSMPGRSHTAFGIRTWPPLIERNQDWFAMQLQGGVPNDGRESLIGPVFKHEVEAFLDVTGRRATRFGSEAAGYPWFVDGLGDGAATRLSAVERVRAWMVDTATPSERAVIARMLKDAGSTPFVHGASAFLQGGGAAGKGLPGVRRGQGCQRSYCPTSPPGLSDQAGSGQLPQDWRTQAGTPPGGRRRPSVLPIWKSGVLCAC